MKTATLYAAGLTPETRPPRLSNEPKAGVLVISMEGVAVAAEANTNANQTVNQHEIRRPKAEIRKKPENRNPKLARHRLGDGPKQPALLGLLATFIVSIISRLLYEARPDSTSGPIGGVDIRGRVEFTRKGELADKDVRAPVLCRSNLTEQKKTKETKARTCRGSNAGQL